MKYGKEFKIGLFVVIVLTVSFFLINYLRGEDIFNREMEYISRYENAEGLVASAPVYIKGYKAGKVTEVAYDAESGDFKVVCSVLKEFRVPEDSKMTIYAVDIMGGKGVRIDLGNSVNMAADGSFLQPASEGGLIDELAGSITPLVTKVTSAIDSLSVTVSGVSRLLADENQASIAKTLAHLESTMENVNALAGMIGGKSSEISLFVDNLASLSAKFSSIADKVDTTMTGVSSIADAVSKSDIEGLVASFNTLLESINDPDGTIGKLLVDKSVYDSVDTLLADVDSLVRKIQENPKKYIKISVF